MFIKLFLVKGLLTSKAAKISCYTLYLTIQSCYNEIDESTAWCYLHHIDVYNYMYTTYIPIVLVDVPEVPWPPWPGVYNYTKLREYAYVKCLCWSCYFKQRNTCTKNCCVQYLLAILTLFSCWATASNSTGAHRHIIPHSWYIVLHSILRLSHVRPHLPSIRCWNANFIMSDLAIETVFVRCCPREE